jgi:hypothetical protein
MRKLVLLILCLISISAYAKWTLFDHSKENTEDHYIDYSRIQRNGQYVTYFDMTDFKYPQKYKGKIYRSWVAEVIINCSNLTMAIFSIHRFSENLLLGYSVSYESFDNTTSKYINLSPQTIGEAKAKEVCKR